MELLYERLEREGEDGKSSGCFLAPQAFGFLLPVQKALMKCCQDAVWRGTDLYSGVVVL